MAFIFMRSMYSLQKFQKNLLRITRTFCSEVQKTLHTNKTFKKWFLKCLTFVVVCLKWWMTDKQRQISNSRAALEADKLFNCCTLLIWVFLGWLVFQFRSSQWWADHVPCWRCVKTSTDHLCVNVMNMKTLFLCANVCTLVCVCVCKSKIKQTCSSSSPHKSFFLS